MVAASLEAFVAFVAFVASVEVVGAVIPWIFLA